jgi:aldose 1-epimerase
MKNTKRALLVIAAFVFSGLLFQCINSKKEETKEKSESMIETKLPIIKSDFGSTKDGVKIEEYTLKNTNGVELKVITYGGRITSLKVPDKNGSFDNVILGFDNIEAYEADNPFFGALIGRFGNRIANGKFSLDGKEYTLAQNDGNNHLHGGVKGFDRAVWKATPMEGEESSQLILTYFSKNGEEGYPGNLNVTVVYTLTEDNALEVNYKATTDETTVINLTQHAYFNLTGDFSNDILSHDLMLNADAFLPVDSTLIPTGEIRPVEGTPFDFRTPKPIGKDINKTNEQLKRGLGFDHCWVLNGEAGEMRLAASAIDESSGRKMEIFTIEPAIQFYSGNFLDGTLPMPEGGFYERRTGFCLETQHYPDSPNQEKFPSVTLKPGQIYKTKTTFKFSVE